MRLYKFLFLVGTPLLVTHDGNAQGDDVMTTALLKILFPDAQVVRDRKNLDRYENQPNVIMYDVGGSYDPDSGRFDHHSVQGVPHYVYKTGRKGSSPMSSVGLVFKKFGGDIVRALLQSISADRFEEGHWCWAKDLAQQALAKIRQDEGWLEELCDDIYFRLINEIDAIDTGLFNDPSKYGIYTNLSSVVSLANNLLGFIPPGGENVVFNESVGLASAVFTLSTLSICAAKCLRERQRVVELRGVPRQTQPVNERPPTRPLFVYYVVDTKSGKGGAESNCGCNKAGASNCGCNKAGAESNCGCNKTGDKGSGNENSESNVQFMFEAAGKNAIHLYKNNGCYCLRTSAADLPEIPEAFPVKDGYPWLHDNHFLAKFRDRAEFIRYLADMFDDCGDDADDKGRQNRFELQTRANKKRSRSPDEDEKGEGEEPKRIRISAEQIARLMETPFVDCKNEDCKDEDCKDAE
ncbi:MAG: hypothetical protein E6Q06_02115 [Candidatus Moraniibacteriota bacterium]|nr:MAG: hypothetical protein E6Q06_02115 [Candidatus Moranbacteria bacterium]